MTVRQTVLYADAKGDKVHVTLSEAENEYLKSLTNDNVRHSTKGIKASELVAMYTDPIYDPIDKLEARVDQELEEAGIEWEEDFSEESEIGDTTEDRKQRVMFLPPQVKSTLDDLDGYNSTILGECLNKYSRSEYDDRAERIEAKESLLESGESETTQEEKFRYEEVCLYPRHADEVKQTPAARSDYLQEYLDFMGENLGYTADFYPKTRDELIDLVLEFYGCSEPSAETYADRVSLRLHRVEQEKEDQYTESDEFRELVEDTKKWDSKTLYPADYNYEMLLSNLSELEKHNIYLLHYKQNWEDRYEAVHDPESDDVGSVVERDF